VLFNEPKLLKSSGAGALAIRSARFSALQRAEIAEIVFPSPVLAKLFFVSVLFNEPKLLKFGVGIEGKQQRVEFQCSSTSRNC